ncbi:MAG: DUF5681 domain-containing protein [Gammaproteobacteria bacterium]|nr:DUF5681 domain-containing protein [Gammaproteobacteria bacterium]
MTDKTGPKEKPWRFKRGQSGNPKGRPRGSRNTALVALDKIGEDAAQGLLQTVIAKALNGDMGAARILLDRVWPVRKGRPVVFDAPSIQSAHDIVRAIDHILTATAAGQLTIEEAAGLTTIIEAQRKAIETSELDSRITELERRHKYDTRNQN